MSKIKQVKIMRPRQMQVGQQLISTLLFIKHVVDIDFLHTKHSRYYRILVGNEIFDVNKNLYYEIKDLFEHLSDYYWKIKEYDNL